MKILATLTKEQNIYKGDKPQWVTVRVANMGEKNAVVRLYDGEMTAANYLTDVNVPPMRRVERSIMAQDIVCEFISEKTAVGIIQY